VHPTEEHQDAVAVRDPENADGSVVARRAGRREAAEFRDRDLAFRRAEGVGGGGPTGAEDDRGVEGRRSGQLSQPGGAGPGECEGIGAVRCRSWR
jgi:hypothetical protein